MQPLDPLTVPLHGRQLIEASAGTGKTYTIVLLYLRLLLEEAVPVDRILVLTFTRAATEELRARIRSRIREGLGLLRRRTGRTQADPFLLEVLSRAGGSDRCEQLLADAMLRLDEAAIYTIHGFCQRMLQDHAFESAVAYELEFLPGETALRLQIMEDFWRLRFYRAGPEEACWVIGEWKDPAALYREVEQLARWPEATFVPRVDKAELARLQEEQEAIHARLQTLWPQERQQVEKILCTDSGLRRGEKNYRQDQLGPILADMDQLVNSAPDLRVLPQRCSRLASSWMAENLKKNGALPRNPVFSLMDRLVAVNGQWLAGKRIDLLLSGRTYLLEELRRRKQEEAWMAFDDLLVFLDQALSGPQGDRLGRLVRSRFPYALVDEFQDTDPVQYRIFQAIYGKQPAGGLFLIGDPKQAIYAFRGADIFTYLRAREETPPASRYTMTTNYRASTPMIEAVNRLFSVRGAFVLGEGIGYQPVRSSQRHDDGVLRIDGQVQAPFTVLLLGTTEGSGPAGELLGKEEAGEEAVETTCRQIVLLLQGAARGRARLGERPLRAADIAVLVRTNQEAARIRAALTAYGVGAVYTGQESVFRTEEARELEQVLAALCFPGDEAMVRRALATSLFGLQGRDIAELLDREQVWEQWRNDLEVLRKTWHERGLGAMFHVLLRNHGVVQRLSALPDGERKLTNFIHLVELLQEEEPHRLGMERLLRRLRRERTISGDTMDSQLLRLEDDQELVRIVTLHKAKGLEYPLVFLPFLWHGRSMDKKNNILVYHDREAKNCPLVVNLRPDGAARALAEEEQLAEELRLLYVGITRAKNNVFFCWGPVKGVEQTGLAYLLARRSEDRAAPVTGEKAVEPLRSLDQGEGIVRFVVRPPAVSRLEQTDRPSPRDGLQVKIFQGQIDRSWQVSSYSHLVAGQESSPLVTGNREQTPEAGRPDRFHFDRGPAAGTCLHAILEQLDFSSPGSSEATELIREELLRAGLDPAWQEAVQEWLGEVCVTELIPGCSLADLGPDDQVREMGFYFSLQRTDMNQVNEVLRRYNIAPLAGRESTLNGLMTGYIDLVFSWQDRYYVVDYKSNYLGPSARDYDQAGLARAMREHRYDLQYLIYTVALHRYLGCRIRHYSSADHLGGILYLFLRGMKAGTDNGIFFRKADPDLVAGLDRCFGQGGVD